MIYSNVIEGRYVNLASATVDDAEFTLNIRQDAAFERFLPRINQTIDRQIAWIKEQRKKAGDYFFVVRNKNHFPIGTIGIYGIDSDRPESGRLALKGNAFENFEAAYLLYEFAFHILEIDCLYGFVYSDNKRAIRYNRQFGVVMQEEHTDKNGKTLINVSISAKDFDEHKKLLGKMIYRGNN